MKAIGNQTLHESSFYDKINRICFLNVKDNLRKWRYLNTLGNQIAS